MPPSSSSQFYLSTYFMVNTLLIIAYPLLRLYTSAGNRDLKRQDYYGFSYENSIIYTALALALIGYSRSTSNMGFACDFFYVGKIAIGSLLVFAKFQFAIIYGVICVLLWSITPYPKYIAPNKFIKIRSVEHFDQITSQHKSLFDCGNHNKKSKNSQEQQSPFHYQDKWMYFIQFYADWALPCMLSKELWYQYSNKYTTERLKFLQVHVDRVPQLAKRFKINTSGFSKQLPSIVILTNGEEEMRFPPVDEDNKVKKVVKLDYRILLKYFDLESRYLQTRGFLPQNNLEAKPKAQ